MVNSDTYKTLASAPETSLYKDKGSKFIGYAYPLSNDNVKDKIEFLKKKHHAARHWCYAYKLGLDENHHRINDDGEPKNSAGQPIFGQIIAHNLTNVLVVVVRYYGGINLGVGGLITAYKTAAKLVLENAVIIEKTVDVIFELTFDYQYINKIMRIIKEQKLTIKNQKMEMNCVYEVVVRKNLSEKIKRLFNDLRCLTLIEKG